MTVTSSNLRRIVEYCERHGKTESDRWNGYMARHNMDTNFMDSGEVDAMLSSMNDYMENHTISALMEELADESAWRIYGG